MTNEDIKRYLTAERDAMKTGYSIKTWKMRLFCPEKQMIETTEALYRDAVAFYYELLKEREELWAENLLTIQGHLEKLTVPGRDGREPKYIPPGGKLPVYFRRSAMNKAAIPWIKGSSKALKSVCIGHNCELSEADVRKLLEENKIGTDVQIKQSECTYRIR